MGRTLEQAESSGSTSIDAALQRVRPLQYERRQVVLREKLIQLPRLRAGGALRVRHLL
jgi:hypothetical protein